MIPRPVGGHRTYRIAADSKADAAVVIKTCIRRHAPSIIRRGNAVGRTGQRPSQAHAGRNRCPCTAAAILQSAACPLHCTGVGAVTARAGAAKLIGRVLPRAADADEVISRCRRHDACAGRAAADARCYRIRTGRSLGGVDHGSVGCSRSKKRQVLLAELKRWLNARSSPLNNRTAAACIVGWRVAVVGIGITTAGDAGSISSLANIITRNARWFVFFRWWRIYVNALKLIFWHRRRRFGCKRRNDAERNGKTRQPQRISVGDLGYASNHTDTFKTTVRPYSYIEGYQQQIVVPDMVIWARLVRIRDSLWHSGNKLYAE